MRSHVTAFRPISEAARSWSDDNVLCRGKWWKLISSSDRGVDRSNAEQRDCVTPRCRADKPSCRGTARCHAVVRRAVKGPRDGTLCRELRDATSCCRTTRRLVGHRYCVTQMDRATDQPAGVRALRSDVGGDKKCSAPPSSVQPSPANRLRIRRVSATIYDSTANANCNFCISSYISVLPHDLAAKGLFHVLGEVLPKIYLPF